jgi:hypothetical protein
MGGTLRALAIKSTVKQKGFLKVSVKYEHTKRSTASRSSHVDSHSCTSDSLSAWRTRWRQCLHAAAQRPRNSNRMQAGKHEATGKLEAACMPSVFQDIRVQKQGSEMLLGSARLVHTCNGYLLPDSCSLSAIWLFIAHQRDSLAWLVESAAARRKVLPDIEKSARNQSRRISHRQTSHKKSSGSMTWR